MNEEIIYNAFLSWSGVHDWTFALLKPAESAVASVGSVEDTIMLKDAGIMTQVLGRRSWYQKGNGILSWLKTVVGICATFNNSIARHKDKEEIVALKAELEQQKIAMQEQADAMQKQQSKKDEHHEQKAAMQAQNAIIEDQQSLFAKLQLIIPGLGTAR